MNVIFLNTCTNVIFYKVIYKCLYMNIYILCLINKNFNGEKKNVCEKNYTSSQRGIRKSGLVYEKMLII